MANFTIYKGNDFSAKLTIKQADSFLAQDLTDMSGPTFDIYEMVYNETSGEYEATAVTDLGTITPKLDDDNGVVGIRQEDTLVIGSTSVSAGDVFSITANGYYMEYVAVENDTVSNVRDGLIAIQNKNISLTVDTDTNKMVMLGTEDFKPTVYTFSSNMYKIAVNEAADPIDGSAALNGRLKIKIPGTDTGKLNVEYGNYEDGLYAKGNRYKAVLKIPFTGGKPTINVSIDKIYVLPAKGA